MKRDLLIYAAGITIGIFIGVISAPTVARASDDSLLLAQILDELRNIRGVLIRYGHDR